MTIKANNDGNKTKNREEGERREKKKGKGIEGRFFVFLYPVLVESQPATEFCSQ